MHSIIVSKRSRQIAHRSDNRRDVHGSQMQTAGTDIACRLRDTILTSTLKRILHEAEVLVVGKSSVVDGAQSECAHCNNVWEARGCLAHPVVHMQSRLAACIVLRHCR